MVAIAFNPGIQEAEAVLVYKPSSRTTRAVTQRNPVSKNKQQNKKQKKKKVVVEPRLFAPLLMNSVSNFFESWLCTQNIKQSNGTEAVQRAHVKP